MDNTTLCGTNVIQDVSTYIFCKSKKLTYYDGNPAFIEAIGLTNTKELVGKADYDFPWADDAAQQYRDVDNSILAGNSIFNVKDVRWYKGQYKSLIINKVPIRTENGEIIGIMGIHHEVAMAANLSMEALKNTNLVPFNLINQNKKELIDLINQKLNASLNDKEMDCLALWLSGYSIKESAFCLYLSSKTIEVYRTHIKEKLDINHKFQLIDLTHENGTFDLLFAIAKIIKANKIVK